jgi:hypothetical protein
MEAWRHYIIKAIAQGKKELKSLIADVPPEKEKELLESIRSMLEAQEIYYQSPGQLQIFQPNSQPIKGN